MLTTSHLLTLSALSGAFGIYMFRRGSGFSTYLSGLFTGGSAIMAWLVYTAPIQYFGFDNKKLVLFTRVGENTGELPTAEDFERMRQFEALSVSWSMTLQMCPEGVGLVPAYADVRYEPRCGKVLIKWNQSSNGRDIYVSVVSPARFRLILAEYMSKHYVRHPERTMVYPRILSYNGSLLAELKSGEYTGTAVPVPIKRVESAKLLAITQEFAYIETRYANPDFVQVIKVQGLPVYLCEAFCEAYVEASRQKTAIDS